MYMLYCEVKPHTAVDNMLGGEVLRIICTHSKEAYPHGVYRDAPCTYQYFCPYRSQKVHRSQKHHSQFKLPFLRYFSL